MGIRVRAAELSDVDWLVGQCRDFANLQQTKLSIFPAQESTIRELLEDMIKNHLFLIAVKGEQRLGFLAAYQLTHPFNPGIRMLTEAFWYVAQEFQKFPRAMILLLDTYVEYGRANAEWTFIALQSVNPINPDILTRRGFRAHEAQYILEVVR